MKDAPDIEGSTGATELFLQTQSDQIPEGFADWIQASLSKHLNLASAGIDSDKAERMQQSGD
jgi:hypothetical protein